MELDVRNPDPALAPAAMFQAPAGVVVNGGEFNAVQGNQTINNTHIYNAQTGALPEASIEDRRKALLKIIPPNKFRLFHQDITEKRTPLTGESYLMSMTVQDWVKTLDSIIWGTGGPGAGKTYLASALIELVERLAERSPDIAAVFAYLHYTDSEQLTTWDVVMAFIRQLVESEPLPQIIELVEAVFKKHELKETRPSLGELVKILQEILKQFRQRFVSIDGLDEMPPEMQAELLDILLSLAASISITSRPLDVLASRFANYTLRKPIFFDIVAQSEDLDVFISNAIQSAPGLEQLLLKHDMRNEVALKIKDGASGMFLHAALQLESLRGCVSVGDIDEETTQFPAKIEDLYSRAMKRIERQPERQATLAKRILVWVLYIKGTLSIEDLGYAVAVSPVTHQYNARLTVSEAVMLSVCHGLVTIDKESRQVRLIHLSARDPLRRLLATFDHHPHDMIARSCLARLIDTHCHDSSVQTVGERQKLFSANPLLEYAYKNTPYHIHEGAATCPSLLDLAGQFARSCESFPYLNRIQKAEDSTPIYRLAPLHVAVLFNLSELVHQMITDEGFDVNALAHRGDSDHWTGLMLASREGWDIVVQRLLGIPNTNLNVRDGEGRSALWIATLYGHHSVVKLLMQRSSVLINKADRDGWSPLIVAARYGHTATVAQLLTSPTVDVNRREDKEGWSALFLASDYAEEVVVEMLLKHPATNVNQLDREGWSPLMIACVRGNVGVVKQLLKAPGINIRATDHQGMSAFMKTAHAGRADVLEELLLVPGHDTNMLDKAKRSALMLAVYSGSLLVVGRLLRIPGINPNLATPLGWTPVMEAAYQGNIAILERLIAFPSTNLQAMTIHRETILVLTLQYHTKKYHEEQIHQVNNDVVRTCIFLLQHKQIRKLVNTPDLTGRTALFLAAKFGYTSLVDRLLEIPGIVADAVMQFHDHDSGLDYS